MNRVLQIFLVILSTANLLSQSQPRAASWLRVSGAEIIIAWQQATSTHFARTAMVLEEERRFKYAERASSVRYISITVVTSVSDTYSSRVRCPIRVVGPVNISMVSSRPSGIQTDKFRPHIEKELAMPVLVNGPVSNASSPLSPDVESAHQRQVAFYLRTG